MSYSSFFFGIGEDGVGLVDLLELVLGALVVRIAVGMILDRQFSEGLLDLVGRGAFLHPEGLVVISLRHFHHPPFVILTTM